MATVFEQLKARQEQMGRDPNAEPQTVAPQETPQGDSAPEAVIIPEQQQASHVSQGEDISEEVRSQVKESVLKSIFGEDAKSIDDAKAHYSNLRSSVDSYKGKIGEFEKQLQEKIDPFANEKVKRYNQWAKKSGNDDFRVFNLIETMNEEQATTNPLDVAIAGRVLENPGFAGKEPIIREIILEELGLDPDSDLSELNDRQKLRLDAMAQQAVRSIREQKNLIGEIETTPTLEDIQAQRKAKYDETHTKWSPVVEALLPSVEKYVLGEGETAFTFEFDKSKLSEYGKLATDYLVKNGKDFTEQSVKEAALMIRNGLVMENFDSIMSAHAKYVHNLKQEEYDRLYSNPSALDPKLTEPRGGQTPQPLKSGQDQLREFQERRQREMRNNS